MLSWEAGFFRVSGQGRYHTILREGGPAKPPHAYSVAAVLPLRVILLSSAHEELLDCHMLICEKVCLSV